MPVPCPHRRVFIWPDSRFIIWEKRREFHPLGLQLLGLTCWEAFRIRQGVALARTRQLPRQLSASLKLSETEMKLQGFIGGSRQRHTREQRDRRQCRQLHRRERAWKHIDKHRPTTQNWGMGPPEFSYQIESFLLRQTTSSFTEGPRIYTGLTAPDTFLLHRRPRIYTGLPAPDTFLLYSRPHIYTGLPALDTFLLYSRPRIYTGLPRPA